MWHQPQLTENVNNLCSRQLFSMINVAKNKNEVFTYKIKKYMAIFHTFLKKSQKFKKKKQGKTHFE